MSEAMPRNRFGESTSNIDLAHGLKLNKEDRMIKVAPLYNMLNCRCCKFSSNRDNKLIDESMVLYLGRQE